MGLVERVLCGFRPNGGLDEGMVPGAPMHTSCGCLVREGAGPCKGSKSTVRVAGFPHTHRFAPASEVQPLLHRRDSVGKESYGGT